MLDIIVNPFITILLFLYRILGGNVVLTIIVFTILVRLVTYPLTIKSQRSSKAMQELQPELKKLQEKYKNDRERLAQAQWELYRQYGVNPLAGCLPLIIQLPILLGLYRAIVTTLAATPLELLNLSGRLLVPGLSNEVPLQNRFLWLNLTAPDPLYLLPVLVVVTTWLQQKLLMPATPAGSSGDRSADQASQISRQMMMIMPLMFGFFSLSFASGLSIYFIVSNLIGIGQYALQGKVKLTPATNGKAKEMPKAASQAAKSEIPEKAKRGVEPAQAPAPKPKRTGLSRPVTAGKSKRTGIYDSRVERARVKSKAKG
ncbi:MAG TPA: YidC/Oxa1 family membrane protein insertase [Aggregatilineaceae bacterium]|nr:YidC/Oxa1 family membrane protein insertase [Aggregatilineaceae bacterium]